MEPERMTAESGRQIAFHRLAGRGPVVVFLGGFKSDMSGTKATWLEDLCRERGQGYLRFDYSGHGVSSGAFTDGCIGDWLEDARDVIGAQTEGPLILVGSSMGGWISLLLAREWPDRVAGLVTVAAAPDFTDRMFDEMTATQRAELEGQGMTHLPSDYGDPYPITRRLIEDGRNRRVLDRPLRANFPVRMVQGTEDNAVSEATATRLLAHIDGDDVRLTLVKGGDHSLSDTRGLSVIGAALDEVSGG